MLNWLYPDSLHVQAEIWSAQETGKLPYMEPAPGEGDAVRFEQIASALKELGTSFGKMAKDRRSVSFSCVLVESSLWTRYKISDTEKSVDIDVSGPDEGDLVIVTGEPVLHAIVQGDMTLSGAVSNGLMKLYGEPQQIEDYIAAYGEAGG